MLKCSSVRNIWVSVLGILSVSPGNTDEKIELNQTQKFENEIFWPIKKYYLIFSLNKLTKQSDDDCSYLKLIISCSSHFLEFE